MATGRPVVSSVSEDSIKGPDELLLRAVAQRLGTKIGFRYAPFKRRLIMMKNGDVDLICGLLRRPERETDIHFISPPYKTRSDTIFFVPKGRGGPLQTYEDLKGLRIGVVRGSNYFRKFDRDQTLVKEAAYQTAANFRKLLAGRLDTVIQAEFHGIDLMHKMGLSDQLDIAGFRFSKEKKVYFGISKQSWMMGAVDRIQAVLAQMIETGEVKTIIRTYYTRRGLPVPAF